MPINISGINFKVRVLASRSFPVGFEVSQFADDTDPFDVPSQQIGDGAMNINGNLATWGRANPIKINIAVLSGSDDDTNLSFLAEANRPGLGKLFASDVITMIAVYDTGKILTYTGGIITDAILGEPIASVGRKKSKTYGFMFENRVVA